MRELDLDLLRERLSPHALRILSVSIEESRRRNHNFIAAEHILFALCKNEPQLIQGCFCGNSLKLEELKAQTKDFLDKTHPHVGRSLKMTPELHRTMRIAWENTQQNNRHHMESFDLVEALQKTGTSAVWQKIREEGISEEQLHLNLKNYEKTYFLNKQIKVRKQEFQETESLLDETIDDLIVQSNLTQASMSPALRLFSMLIVLSILTFFILAIVRC